MQNFFISKNIYLEELKSFIQLFFNEYRNDDELYSVKILMKNSRTYYLLLSENITVEMLQKLLIYLYQSKEITQREPILEAYFTTNHLQSKFYHIAEDFYCLNSNQELFKWIEVDFIQQKNKVQPTFEIPSFPKPLHEMENLDSSIEIKKTWWKFWKN